MNHLFRALNSTAVEDNNVKRVYLKWEKALSTVNERNERTTWVESKLN